MSRARTSALAATAVLAGTLASAPVAALELRRGDARLELTGQLRSLFTFTRDLGTERLFVDGSTRRGDAGLWLTRGRLEALAYWRDWLRAGVTYDQELLTGSGLDGLGVEVGRATGNRTWADLDRDLSDREDLLWRHLIYRGWIQLEGHGAELTLGRQRIPLGKARLWNPTDLFNPIGPLAIESDQRIGQDAARLRLRIRRGLWIEGIWSPQDSPDDHRFATRIELTRRRVDASLMVGRFRRDRVLGADLAVNWKGATLRSEATLTDLDRGRQIWQVVFGGDYTVGWGAGLYVLVEHFYDENRISRTALSGSALGGLGAKAGVKLLGRLQADTFDRFAHVGRHQTGVGLGYDLTPLWRADLLTLYDWSGPSAIFAPVLTWSARANLEVSASAQLSLGRDEQSDYGKLPPLLILRADWFF